mgnify:FL=1
MQYFFILGRNPLLSKAEIFSYLESNKIQYQELCFHENILIIDADITKINIQDFGGIIKLGKIQFRGKTSEFLKFLDSDEVIPEDKFSYTLIGNTEFEDNLIQKFKQEKKKAMIRRGRRILSLQEGSEFSLTNADFEIFIFNQDNKIYQGLVEQTYNYSAVKKRDMQKPIRRESLAISPRLAKILINLSQVKKGQLLLDPFCGIGGILLEAVVQGINVHGIDNDPEAVRQCQQNLNWVKRDYQTFANSKIETLDANNTPNLQVDAIVSESSLGELVKQKIDKKQAKEFILKFESFIIPILKRLKQIKKPGAKIVLTLPFVREYSVNLDEVCSQTGLKICNLPGLQMPIKELLMMFR